MAHLIRGMAALAVLAFGAACTHTTTITAKPKGTKIYVDDEYLGEDKVTVDLDNGMMGAYKLRAEKPGEKPLDVEVSRAHFAWGPLGTAIGGCLAGGCAGGAGALLLSTVVPPLFFASPCCAAVTGAPFLVFIMWMSQGPDQIDIDVAARTIKTTPETEATVVGGDKKKSEGAGDSGGSDTGDDTGDDPIDDTGEDPVMQPFDY